MPPQTESDAPLRRAMQSVAAGEIDAFRTVAESLEPRLMRFFAQLGVPETDRDDLFQDTCLRLYRGANAYDAGRPFLPWALTVARRVMLNWNRSRKPTVALDDAAEISDAHPTPDKLAESDLWAFARSRLPAGDYELLWLRYGEALTPAEIAAVLRRTSVQVRVYLYRARNRLARALEREDAGAAGNGRRET